MDGTHDQARSRRGRCFKVLDGVWLGLLMKNFYRSELAPIVRLADGGIALFVIPRVSTAWSAAVSMVVWMVAR